MKVLVTGGAGYIGSILCEHLLDAGYHVTAIDNLIYGQNGPFHLAADPRYEFVFGDVRDERIMARLVPQADVLIPLAAAVGAPLCDRDPVFATTVNFEAVQLLNQATKPRASASSIRRPIAAMEPSPAKSIVPKRRR